MNNKKERIDILEEILLKLHNGAEPKSVQAEFNQHFKGVSAIEISMMEHQLMFGKSEITFEDVLKLCNVHANMFKDSIDEATAVDMDKPGHPVRVFKDENAAFQAAMMRIDNIINALESSEDTNDNHGIFQGLQRQMDLLGQFEIHYERKEKVFFPMMEKYGHTAPSKVMWAKDDEIRQLFNKVQKKLKEAPNIHIGDLKEVYQDFQFEFKEMIFKEEAILLNILIETLRVEDWYQIAQESPAYGFAIIPVIENWQPTSLIPAEKESEQEIHQSNIISEPISDNDSPMEMANSYRVSFSQGDLYLGWVEKFANLNSISQLNYQTPIQIGDGILNLSQVHQIMEYLPLDLAYFNKQGLLQYANHTQNSQNRYRSQEQLYKPGQQIYNKQLWNNLEPLFQDLLIGKSKEEAFWFQRENEYLHYSYHAIEDQGSVIGILEIIHDLQPYLNISQDSKRELTPLDHFKGIEPRRIHQLSDNHISPMEFKQIEIGDISLSIHLESHKQENPENLRSNQLIEFPGGHLSKTEIELILNTVPMEISFVDNHDVFQYYNNHVPDAEMIFKRTPVQVGRNIELCHPPYLWPMVDELFKSFKEQQRYFEKMWYRNNNNQLIYTHYQANYDQNNQYLGVLETVQDIQAYIDLIKKTNPFK